MSEPLSYGYDRAAGDDSAALTVARLGDPVVILASLAGHDAQAVHDLINQIEAELAALRTRAETAEAQVEAMRGVVEAATAPTLTPYPT